LAKVHLRSIKTQIKLEKAPEATIKQKLSN